MASQEDVRRIASQLPETIPSVGERFAISVLKKGKEKGFVWEWSERVHPKKAKVLNPDVLAVLVRNLDIKEILLSSNSPAIFTEPHYNGYPAILVRLSEIGLEELEDLVIEAWRCIAPPGLVLQFDSSQANFEATNPV